jgi:predicted kinase
MKVIILSGVSGSGKTTYAKDLLSDPNRLGTAGLVSADQYFIQERKGHTSCTVWALVLTQGQYERTPSSPHGEYLFDASKLSEAHADCFRRFIDHLRAGTRLVIVDNTNTTNEEIAPYYLGAQAFGYEVEIVTFDVRLKIGQVHLENFAKRNSHGVSANVIWKQMVRLSGRKLLPWWHNTTITVRP